MCGYKNGDLSVVWSCCSTEEWTEDNIGPCYANMDDEGGRHVGEAQFRLPHQCDAWVIGNVDDLALMMEELAAIGRRFPQVYERMAEKAGGK